MIEHVLTFSVRQRWFVVLLTAIAAGWGLWSLVRLPIDAVPDITNNQVQINPVATALSPSEIEKQVTLPVETSLAGIPGLEYTRSMSRNGFSEVTAVFSDRTDIYFARQQVGERLTEVLRDRPNGALAELVGDLVPEGGQPPQDARGEAVLATDGRQRPRPRRKMKHPA